MHDKNRRNLLITSGTLLTASMLGSLGIKVLANEHEERGKSKKGIPAVVVSEDKEGICATCLFWGGIRRTSEDRETVYCESIGWCNNSESPNYQAMTTPVTGPMKSWRKWPAL